MTLAIFRAPHGEVVLPSIGAVLVDREDGGHLIVNPARPVWDRSALNSEELTSWGFLVAATGRAMLEVLPVLDGGCINYWDAGNWALNVGADPEGPKRADEYRVVHMHLLGRSPHATSPDLQWGEAPMFPRFEDRVAWAARHRRLSPESSAAIAERIGQILTATYGLDPSTFQSTQRCTGCGYAVVMEPDAVTCEECGSRSA